MHISNLAAGVFAAATLLAADVSAAAVEKTHLQIETAYFGLKNVTVAARKNMVNGTGLVVANPGLRKTLETPEPWPGHDYNWLFAFIYSYSNDTSMKYFYSVGIDRPWAENPTSPVNASLTVDEPVPEYHGFYQGNIIKLPTIIKPANASADFEIIAAAFGGGPIYDPIVFDKLYNHATAGTNFTINQALFTQTIGLSPKRDLSDHPLQRHPYARLATIWYKKNGTLKALVGVNKESYHF